MTATSDERREVAERLREHDGNAHADVADMCDEDLADLIDPTCKIVPFDEESMRLPHCSVCGQPMLKPWPNHCPNCGWWTLGLT